MDILRLVSNLQHLRLVARALAFIADQFDVGEELHFDRDGAVSLAVFAAATGDIEGEMPGRKTAFLRFRQRREHIPDHVESLDVRNWIRARRSSDGRLIDQNDFVEILVAVHFIPARHRGVVTVRLSESGGQRLIQHVVK